MMEYHLALKNKVMLHASTWMDLVNILLIKRSQSLKSTYHMIPFI